MFRKVKIKILLSVFVVLLALVVLVQIIDARKGDRTFKKELVNVNADDVTSIQIAPKISGGEVITLKKDNDNWKVVSKDGEVYGADKGVASNLINTLNRIKPESLVTASKDKWKQYDVTDSLGTNVKLLKGSDVLADVYVGKFSFSQPRKMTSYVRLASDKEVYGVDGFLSMTFNRELDSFRDKTVISSSKIDWVKLQYTYPADSSFTLAKMGDKWQVDGVAADSASVASYLSTLAHVTGSEFAETKPSGTATHILRIEGNNMMTPVEVKGYYQDTENIIVESNQNPGAYFDGKNLMEKLFPPKRKFFAE